jgi:hypothetical protein
MRSPEKLEVPKIGSQLTIFDVIEASQIHEATSQNSKRWEDLTSGDYVEVWWGNGLHFAGWITSMRNDHHVQREWEIQTDWIERHGGDREIEAPWQETYQRRIRFTHLSANDRQWRWVRHDDDYELRPTADELRELFQKHLADCRPSDSVQVAHMVTSLWPSSMGTLAYSLYNEVLLARWPDIKEYLADKKLTRYPLPKPVKARIQEMVKLPGEKRLEALASLHWDKTENRSGWHLSLGSIGGSFIQHWLVKTDDPKVLVELALLCGHWAAPCDHDEQTA